jgi:hypothetical protein
MSGAEDRISFSIESGAYFIETNGGGQGIPMGDPILSDPTITAYGANAACAMYSRKVAEEMYGCDRPYGYAFGGSGGAFRTIGGMENTEGVWDGAVPYVVGSPMAIPNVFCVRMHAMRILKEKFPQIIDSLEPGGSGEMYASLNEEEVQALQEVTRMGFPPEAWFGYKNIGLHGFAVLYMGMVMADPQYFQEFWTTPGYLGADSPESFIRYRIQHQTTIKSVITLSQALEMGLEFGEFPPGTRGTADKAYQQLEKKEQEVPIGVQFSQAPPDIDFIGGDLIINSGNSAGQQVLVVRIVDDIAVFGMADPRILMTLQPGDEVQLDNSNFLAAQTYHRHQVPGKDYPVWDQFCDEKGQPLYPQRPMLLGPIFTQNASGTVPTGKFKEKMIMLGSLWDREAYPWQVDWYRRKAEECLGDRFINHYVVWYTEHALHDDSEKQEDPTHTISYLGVLQQALRDLSVWVEKGIAPPASTIYDVGDGQVTVPATAKRRRGIQPVVNLTANGGKRADITAGETIQFTAEIEVPDETGSIVCIEWDFEGAGDFPVKENLKGANNGLSKAVWQATHTFMTPGTYFPIVRVASQREGNLETIFTRIQNLDRVRVVVH